ncbi:ABC transporter permease [Dactylosporangium sp. NPDC006015]|uniref:ABC transporter permease n=1 Tax=Dactylosporangium sp. NPDC006015 TaxID=3154576 RepID=UPI0033BF0A3B
MTAERTRTASPTARPAETEPRARFADLLAAEWIKFWSLRSTAGGLALIAVLIVGSAVQQAMYDRDNWGRWSPEERAAFYPLRDAFVHNSYLVAMLAAGAIGAVTLVSEYGSGLIRTTFAAVPARRSLLAAKACVLAGVMSAVGAFIAVSAFLASQAILADHRAGLSIRHPGVPRAITGCALLLPVCALVGMGIAALLRHPASTIVTTTGVLLFLPLFFSPEHRWSREARNTMPLVAYDRLTDINPHPWGLYPPSLAEAWAVFAAWPLIALLIGLAVVHRRDV